MAHADATGPNRPEARSTTEGPQVCSICDAPVNRDAESFPFCSRRCRMIDLGRWLGGRYVVSRPISDDDLTNHG